MPSSVISVANLAEAMTKYVEDGGEAKRIAEDIETSPCEIAPITLGQAIAAAEMRKQTKVLGLSLGDRICLALAMERKCPVMTADRAWAKLAIGVKIVVIR
jgi:ribonuclease VapC